ncbi:MAG TPA: thioesterase family protein [Polyangiales bacterium]|jgi:acyl-CoA thioester hydrolase|nr:thioesterase family protein [Polyangiales bacterium]
MQDNDFEPNTRAFPHEFVVTAEDIDEFGHANNVVWVRWVNEAAMAHSRAVGLDPQTLIAMRAMWIIRKHEIEYLAPAFVGERIVCTTWPAAVRGATSLRRNVFTREGRVLARCATTWALLNTETGRPRRVPIEMMEAYGFPPELARLTTSNAG